MQWTPSPPTDTNTAYFNRYSADIAEDGALAVFDIIPSQDIAEQVDGEYIYKDPTPPDGIPYLDAVDPGYSFFKIPSNHCIHNSNMYYLRSDGTDYTEMPVVSGLPLNYGGTFKTRYSLLSRDAIAQPLHTGIYPLLAVPSFGIGHQYEDRAKTMEFWLSTEPYAMPVNHNMLDDVTGMLSDGMVAGEHYTFVMSGDGLPFQVADIADKKDSDSDTWLLGFDRSVTFMKSIEVVGGSNLSFNLATKPSTGVDYGYDVVIVVASTLSDGSVVNHAINKRVDISGSGWTTTTIDFSVDSLIAVSNMTISIENMQIVGGDNASKVFMSELGVWRGSGGRWMPSGYDCDSDWEGDIPSVPRQLVSFGGETGMAFELLFDIDFLYLRGYGGIDCYQVGEWGRPMAFAIIDTGTQIIVLLNAEQILSIDKTDVNTSGVFDGEWAVFYISEQFRYLDISTIAIFDQMLSQDILKLHYLYGYGPKSSTVIARNQYDKMYVADGSTVDYSGKVLFPQTHSFTFGTPHSVDMFGNTLTLPEYPLPTIVGGGDIQVHVPELSDWSPIYFTFPAGSVTSISPRKDIDRDARFVTLAMSPSELKEFSVCTVRAPNTNYELEVKLEEWGSDFKVSCRFIYSDSVQTYQGYIDSLIIDGYIPNYNEDYAYDRLTYDEVAGSGTELYPSEFTTVVAQGEVHVHFDMELLSKHRDRKIASIFNSPDVTFGLESETPFRFISINTDQNKSIEFPSLSVGYGISAVSYPSTNSDPFNMLYRSTYSVYPNTNNIWGTQPFLDIAANGYWKANIPLTMFARFVNGVPDLDFVHYSDGGQSPQLVTSLSTNRLSYGEIERWVDKSLKELSGTTGADAIGDYGDIQAHYDSLADPAANYENIGLEISSTPPTLSRFSNPATRVFVTLDSASRWPRKNYESLAIERATTDNFVDFQNSHKSVKTTKWEIFDNWAIRMPRNVNLYRYELGYAVHLSSPSLKTHKPVFKRGEFFGIATGKKPVNAISTLTGDNIYVGNQSLYDGSQSYNIDTPFSAHFGTEVVPASYMSKEFGFFAHGGPLAQTSTIVFPLGLASKIKDLSFNMLWRSETYSRNQTFRETFFGFLQNVGGSVKYFLKTRTWNDDLYGLSAQLVVNEINDYGYDSNGIYHDPTTAPTLSFPVYVDGIENGSMSAGKWHLAQIDLGTLVADEDLLLIITNPQVVVNYVGSHSHSPEPANLMAARTGASTNIVLDDGDDVHDLAYYVDDDAALFIIASDREPDIKRTIQL